MLCKIESNAQFAELNKKITVTLTPKEQAQVIIPADAPDTPQQSTDTITQFDQPTVDVSKKSMVAEPFEIYRPPQPVSRPFRAFGT